jgi:hypothetical protein
MSLYFKDNTCCSNPIETRDNFFQKSVIVEYEEFIAEINQRCWKNAFDEFMDVIHSFGKFLMLKFLPNSLLCYTFIWIPLGILVLPISMKLGSRFSINGCIRNHKNQLHGDHFCHLNTSFNVK